MKVKVFVLSLFLLGLVISSCAPEVFSGRVVDKFHKPPRSWVQYTLLPVGKSFILVPYFYRTPERWVLVIEREDPGETRQVYISSETYEKIKIGDTYTPNAGELREPPAEKRKATEREQQDYGVKPADSSP